MRSTLPHFDRPPTGRAWFTDRKRAGRQYQALAIVLHWTATTDFDGTLAYLREPKNQVSAHYLVSRRGIIYASVPEEHAAWTCGTPARLRTDHWIHGAAPNANLVTLNIEQMNSGAQDWPEAQLDATARLVVDLAQRHGIALDRGYVIGHDELNTAKSDVGGNWDWRAFMQRCQAILAPEPTAIEVSEARRMGTLHHLGELVQVCRRLRAWAPQPDDWDRVEEAERFYHEQVGR